MANVEGDYEALILPEVGKWLAVVVHERSSRSTRYAELANAFGSIRDNCCYSSSLVLVDYLVQIQPDPPLNPLFP